MGEQDGQKAAGVATAGSTISEIVTGYATGSGKKTFTRSQLMNEFWGIEATSGLRSVDVYMRRLREKFEACDDFEIVTVHGLGYKAVLK